MVLLLVVVEIGQGRPALEHWMYGEEERRKGGTWKQEALLHNHIIHMRRRREQVLLESAEGLEARSANTVNQQRESPQLESSFTYPQEIRGHVYFSVTGCRYLDGANFLESGSSVSDTSDAAPSALLGGALVA